MQNHNILPGDYMELPLRDRIFMAASDWYAAERQKEMIANAANP